MRECILKHLKGRTIVMTCHQLHFLRHADQLISLREGTVDEAGTFERLMAAGGGFAATMREHGGDAVEDSSDEEEDVSRPNGGGSEEDSEADTTDSIEPSNLKGQARFSSFSAIFNRKMQKLPLFSCILIRNEGKNGQGHEGTLITKEERAEGHVDSEVYVFYLREFTGLLFVVVAGSFFFGQGSKVLTDWWLGRWSSRDLSVVLFGDTSTMTDIELLDYFVAFWACFSLLQVVMQIVKGKLTSNPPQLVVYGTSLTDCLRS